MRKRVYPRMHTPPRARAYATSGTHERNVGVMKREENLKL
jgi:hypothetical protein